MKDKQKTVYLRRARESKAWRTYALSPYYSMQFFEKHPFWENSVQESYVPAY